MRFWGYPGRGGNYVWRNPSRCPDIYVQIRQVKCPDRCGQVVGRLLRLLSGVLARPAEHHATGIVTSLWYSWVYSMAMRGRGESCAGEKRRKNCQFSHIKVLSRECRSALVPTLHRPALSATSLPPQSCCKQSNLYLERDCGIIRARLFSRFF